jgi:hypothetical protein
LETLINGINLQDIVFPVFKIGIHKPEQENGLVFYYHEQHENTDDGVITQLKYKIVDDKNLPGKTLAQRRLQLTVDEVNLAKIENAIYFLGDLVKLADPKVWFMDSLGKLFQYKRSIQAKLNFYKIKTIIPIKTGGVIIECETMLQRFKALYRPEIDKEYAGILEFGKNKVLYGFYDKKYNSTWRKV